MNKSQDEEINMSMSRQEIVLKTENHPRNAIQDLSTADKSYIPKLDNTENRVDDFVSDVQYFEGESCES